MEFSLKEHRNASDNNRAVSPQLLWNYILISLIGQVALSITTFGLTIFSDQIIHEANHYAGIASSQRSTFQSISITTRRFIKELEAKPQNAQLIIRIQQQLQQQSTDLLIISKSIEDTVGQGTTTLFMTRDEVGKKLKKAKPQLDIFIKLLNTLATTPHELLPHIESYVDRIYLSTAPTGTISISINTLTEELRLKAIKTERMLFLMRTGILIIMISIIISVGIFLIFPVLAKLSKVMDQERDLRIKLEYMAHRDFMTALLNREGLDAIIKELDTSKPYALAVIDLNMFKSINDTFGHAVGDAVLVELGQRLKQACLVGPIQAARIGGDEFAAIHTTANTKTDCEELGSTLLSIFNQPILFMDRSYTIGGSIGIALSSDINGDFDSVLKAADAAMYALKGNSKTGFDVFSEERHVSVTDLNRKSEIESAIIDLEIIPWYQFKVDMRDGSINSLEALARWQHSEKGILSPLKFLADIDQYGLHYKLSISMLTQVLKQLRRWKKAGYELKPVSINLSADVLITKDSLRDLRKIFTEYADVSQFITIEITEDIFLPRTAAVIKKSIALLIKDGIRFSIDDFGSGYASFSHINEFTFHEIKIDKSFIAGIGKDNSSEVILSGLLSIARGLGTDLVAEGIETQQQADFVMNLGCFIAQGYLYSKPAPSSDICQRLKLNNNRNRETIS